MNNKGVVSIEAAISFPLFLFTMLALILITETHTVRGIVYEGAVETAEYMAEYAYLTDSFEEASAMDYPMAMLRFREYVDSDALLDKYVVGGVSGVSFFDSRFPDDEGYIDLYITYYIHINAPFIGAFKHKVKEHIRQKAYLGADFKDEEEEGDENDRYVYVAENGVVYHDTRNCTYLMPSISSDTLSSAEASGYDKCKYCSPPTGSVVFVTEEGECYHTSISCSRLKRTVSRRKLKEVNLPPCSKCGH